MIISGSQVRPTPVGTTPPTTAGSVVAQPAPAPAAPQTLTPPQVTAAAIVTTTVAVGAMTPEELALYKEKCDKEIDDAYKEINANQAEYDKQILTLASGFLALTLVFLKDIVPMKVAAHHWLLYASWGTLTACIVCVLFSYQFSISALFGAMDYWGKRLDPNAKPEFPIGYAAWVKRINLLSGFLFVGGVILAVAFAITNLHRQQEKAMSADTTTNVQSGKPTPPPPPPASPVKPPGS